MVQGYKADAREFVIPNHRSLLNSQHGCRSYQHARIQQAGGHPKGSYLTYLSVYYRIVKGVKVLQDMLENGCFPNKMTFLIMFKGFHDLGKEENNI
ncbi:BnaC03g58090D [Brassica napus]|uniref:BnaC03g58090D protein n=1 Tax=Brassica napus TaxID=3708 RepID=A0A078FFM9_BRANA|nr:BnaC03g58090D [Brassica napus]